MSDNGDSLAYPWGEHGTVLGGMTKREVAAIAAMQGLLANPYYAKQMNDGECSGSLESAALYHADALLAALDPTP